MKTMKKPSSVRLRPPQSLLTLGMPGATLHQYGLLKHKADKKRGKHRIEPLQTKGGKLIAWAGPARGKGPKTQAKGKTTTESDFV